MAAMAGVCVAGLGASCEQRTPPPPPAQAAHAPAGGMARVVGADDLDVLGLADFTTSPPTHGSLDWPALRGVIARAWEAADGAAWPLEPPPPAADALSGRVPGAEVAALARTRELALAHRAEAARRLAAARPDGAARALEPVILAADALARWERPLASEASAGLLGVALEALSSPRGAPLARALGEGARGRMAVALGRLASADPAGRRRAMLARAAAVSDRLDGLASRADGPALAQVAAARYRPGVRRASAAELERLSRESVALAAALADAWEGAQREAIARRVEGRLAADTTGLLAMSLDGAGEAARKDAALRERLARTLGLLR